MNILDRLQDLDPSFPRNRFEDYLVEDVGGMDDASVVLLCESPHTQEMGSSPKTPLMGSSGKSVANVLNRVVSGAAHATIQPIGQLVRSDERFRWLGVMNVCQVPMQKKPYGEIAEQIDDWLELLKDIREKGEAEPLDEGDPIESALKEDLDARLARWKKVVLTVPCGVVARRFCQLLDIDTSGMPRTPHPSRCRWDEAIEVCRTVERIYSVLSRSGEETETRSVGTIGS